MIRWRYLVPRLSLVSLALLFLTLGLDPLARLAIQSLGTRAVGARVELAEADVSLHGLDATFRELTVANPSAPQTNLFEIGEARLDLDAREFLHGRWTVREGVLEGLEFATPRDVSGAIDDGRQREAEAGSGGRCGERLLAWLQAGGERLQAELEQDLHSPRLCRELRRRWPEEYRRLETRCETLGRRVDRLRFAAEEMRQGGLPADAEVYARVAADLGKIRSDMGEIPGELQRLADQLREDREAIREARDHDVAYARERLQLEPLDREGLTRYLLGDEQARRVEQVIAWLQWGRKHLPAKRRTPRPDRGSGRTFYFAADSRPADWVFEHLRVEGEIRVEDRPVPFAGEIRGLTSQQAAYGQPLRVGLQTQGESAVAVEAVLDRRNGSAADRIVVRCPHWKLPPRQLGDPRRLAVEIGSAPAAFELEVRLDGEEISGQLVISQADATIQARLAEGPSSGRLEDRVNQALAGVRGMQMRLDLSGTLNKPRCGLHSNLGPDLARGLNQAVAGELHLRADRLVARIDAEISEEFSEFERLLEDKTQEIRERIALPREQIEQVARRLPGSLTLPETAELPEWLRAARISAPQWLRR